MSGKIVQSVIGIFATGQILSCAKWLYGIAQQGKRNGRLYISGVRRDNAGQHIQYVKIIKAGNGEKDASINSRQFVAELINAGKTSFQTINYVNDKWVYGAMVHVIDGIYLTTDPNDTKCDDTVICPLFNYAML